MDKEMIFTLLLGYFSGFEETVLPYISAAFLGHFLFLSINKIIRYHL